MWNLKIQLNSQKQGAGNSGGEMGSAEPHWPRGQSAGQREYQEFHCKIC